MNDKTFVQINEDRLVKVSKSMATILRNFRTKMAENLEEKSHELEREYNKLWDKIEKLQETIDGLVTKDGEPIGSTKESKEGFAELRKKYEKELAQTRVEFEKVNIKADKLEKKKRQRELKEITKEDSLISKLGIKIKNLFSKNTKALTIDELKTKASQIGQALDQTTTKLETKVQNPVSVVDKKETKKLTPKIFTSKNISKGKKVTVKSKTPVKNENAMVNKDLAKNEISNDKLDPIKKTVNVVEPIENKIPSLQKEIKDLTKEVEGIKENLGINRKVNNLTQYNSWEEYLKAYKQAMAPKEEAAFLTSVFIDKDVETKFPDFIASQAAFTSKQMEQAKDKLISKYQELAEKTEEKNNLEHQNEVKQINNNHEQEMNELKERQQKETEQLKSKHDKELAELNNKHEQEMNDKQAEIDNLQASLDNIKNIASLGNNFSDKKQNDDKEKSEVEKMLEEDDKKLIQEQMQKSDLEFKFEEDRKQRKQELAEASLQRQKEFDKEADEKVAEINEKVNNNFDLEKEVNLDKKVDEKVSNIFENVYGPSFETMPVESNINNYIEKEKAIKEDSNLTDKEKEEKLNENYHQFEYPAQNEVTNQEVALDDLESQLKQPDMNLSELKQMLQEQLDEQEEIKKSNSKARHFK